MSTATETTVTPQPVTTLAAPKSEKLVVHDSGPAAYLFDTARFEHCYRIATSMARSSLLPEHLCMTGPKNNKTMLLFETIVANCFLILNQAMRWGIDPFALPPETYVVANKLGFQGKLVAAVVNARAGLNAPLTAIYNGGRGDDMAAAVFGSREPIPKEAWSLLKKYAKDEDGEAYTDLLAMGVMCIRISVGQSKTDNQMWKNDPQQKLFYSGATKWARRHCPEIMLGVLTDDDLERMRAVADANVAATRVDTLDDLTNWLVGSNGNGRTVDGEVSESPQHPGLARGEIPNDDPPGGAQEVTQRPETTDEIDTDLIAEARAAFNAAYEDGRLSLVGKAEEELRSRHTNEATRTAISGLADDCRKKIKASPSINKGAKQGQLAGT